MTIALLVGSLAVLAVLVGFVAWTRWPTRQDCPACGAPTVPVAPLSVPELLRRHAWQRWCAACGWSGLARRGPDLTDGPVDHDSGFRWNPDRSDAPAFRWAAGEAWRPDGGDGPAETPAHPSGFRWQSGRRPIRFTPRPDDAGDRAADDPSGFRWARRGEER